MYLIICTCNVHVYLQRVSCGEYYTVAATLDNELLFWGTRFKYPFGQRSPKRGSKSTHSRQASTTSISSVTSAKDGSNTAPDVFNNNSSG